MVSLFGLGETDGRETETAVRCALVLLRQLSVGKVAPSAGVHMGKILLHALRRAGPRHAPVFARQ